MVRRAARFGAVTAAAGAWLALAGVAGAADEGVGMVGFTFSPAEVVIDVGDTVTWSNADRVAHTATGTGWATGTVAGGASAEVTFDAAGSYPYVCQFHPSMAGTVVVREVGNGESGGNGAGDRGGDGGGASAPATDTAPVAGAGATPGGWAVAAGLLGVAALAGAGAGARLARPARARAHRRGDGPRPTR